MGNRAREGKTEIKMGISADGFVCSPVAGAKEE
jgi:hypothetical protein